ncbi:uncharacterized protein LOC134813695 isoform X2 [Bolinopsis microptera]|uniref:uncharacterized protein LOC134813695 isoform X2 n=1 Tax=Bolinopsis microptera TaxID=2820187 RepID=UPI00307A53B6
MKILILVLFVFGGTLAERYCFPATDTTFLQESFQYHFTKDASSLYDIMKEVAALPDSSVMTDDSSAAFGNKFQIAYDLSVAALTLKIGEGRKTGKTSHEVSTFSTDNGYDVKTVRMVAMFTDSHEYQMNIIFFDPEILAEDTTTMSYTYPVDGDNAKGTMNDWYVTYAFDEDGQLEVYLSDRKDGLLAEDSKLKTTDKFPSHVWTFLKTQSEDIYADGLFLELSMGPDHPDGVITFQYPIPGDSITDSDIEIVAMGAAGFGYILQRASYPGSSAELINGFSFPECVNTDNYKYTDLVQSENPSCPQPNTVREVKSKMPYGKYHIKETCQSDGYSCWDDTHDTCNAKQNFVCSVSEADATVMTTNEHIDVHVDNVGPFVGMELSEGDRDKVIFLGERLDFICKDKNDGAEYVFEYDPENFNDESQFGYDTISFSCVNDYAKLYTDFKAIFDALKCVHKPEDEPEDEPEDKPEDEPEDDGNDGHDDDCAKTFSCEYSQAATLTSSSAITIVLLVVAFF